MKNSKNELQDIIFGNEQAGPGSQLKKAQNFLRRYAETGNSIEKQQLRASARASRMTRHSVRSLCNQPPIWFIIMSLQ